MGTRVSTEAVLACTHNLYILEQKGENNVYHCTSRFYYINVGASGYTLHAHVSIMNSVNYTYSCVYMYLVVCIFRKIKHAFVPIQYECRTTFELVTATGPSSSK